MVPAADAAPETLGSIKLKSILKTQPPSLSPLACLLMSNKRVGGVWASWMMLEHASRARSKVAAFSPCLFVFKHLPQRSHRPRRLFGSVLFWSLC